MTSRFVMNNPLSGMPLAPTIARAGQTLLLRSGGLAAAQTLGVGTCTVQAPSSPQPKDVFGVLDAQGNASANPVTVDGNGTNIDGAATATIDLDDAGAVFTFDGAQWRRLVDQRTFDGSGVELPLAGSAAAPPVVTTLAGTGSPPTATVSASVVQSTADAKSSPTPLSVVGHVSTPNATPVEVVLFSVTEQAQTLAVDVCVVVTDALANNGGRWQIRARFRVQGGPTLSLVSGGTDPAPDVDDPALVAEVDSSGNDVILRVTGLVAACTFGFEARVQGVVP